MSPDSLMKSMRSLQISGEKLETPKILGVSSFSPDFCGLLRDFSSNYQDSLWILMGKADLRIG